MTNHAIEPLELVTQIVCAHVSNNTVAASLLPSLIQEVHRALSDLETGVSAAAPEKPVPAVPIRKTVYPDYLVCLEDGRKLRLLKRHLRQAFNMTPDQYRERWGLPRDYPMVAPAYAARRSELAKQMKLGRQEAAAKSRLQSRPTADE